MSDMENQLHEAITQLQAQVTAETNVTKAVVRLAHGILNLLQRGVAQAIAEGATPTQLQAIADIANAVQRKAHALGEAVSSNTPASQKPPTPAQEPPAPAHGITAPGPASASQKNWPLPGRTAS
jgi:hypothetical protein